MSVPGQLCLACHVKPVHPNSKYCSFSCRDGKKKPATLTPTQNWHPSMCLRCNAAPPNPTIRAFCSPNCQQDTLCAHCRVNQSDTSFVARLYCSKACLDAKERQLLQQGAPRCQQCAARPVNLLFPSPFCSRDCGKRHAAGLGAPAPPPSPALQPLTPHKPSHAGSHPSTPVTPKPLPPQPQSTQPTPKPSPPQPQVILPKPLPPQPQIVLPKPKPKALPASKPARPDTAAVLATEGNDPTVSKGLSSFLFPWGRTPEQAAGDLPAALARVPLRPSEIEWQAVARLMNETILTDPKANPSIARWPFDGYHISEIQRLDNGQRWRDCIAEPGDQGNRTWRYLFHGTSKAVCEAIVTGQFKQSLMGDFGPGIYLAENSSVSHVFALDKVLCPNPSCKFYPTHVQRKGQLAPAPVQSMMQFEFGGKNVTCFQCNKQNIEKHFHFVCSSLCTCKNLVRCKQKICRECGDKLVNGDGHCYMLVCCVNVGVVKTNVSPQSKDHLRSERDGSMPPQEWVQGSANTVMGKNCKGFTEYVLLKPARIYPAYLVKYEPRRAPGQ